MAVTLVYKVGCNVFCTLENRCHALYIQLPWIHSVGPRWRSRQWKPARLHLELPRLIGPAVQLLVWIWDGADRESLDGTTSNALTRLGKKLSHDLCLPMGLVPDPLEAAFVRSIKEEPKERANWFAYADWLMQQDGIMEPIRGEKIVEMWR